MPSPSSRNRRLEVTLALVASMAGVFAGGVWLTNWMNRPAPPRPLTAIETELPARRIEVTLEDVQATWERLFAKEGRSFRPVEHSFFTRKKASPCVADKQASGPFYCAKDRTLNFDLAFFAAMTPQLREIEEPASKLIIAQIAAAAVQDQLGMLARPDGDKDEAAMTKTIALQADCLTGVWAADAEQRLGAVPARQYALAVQGTRRIVEAQYAGPRGESEVLNSLGVGKTSEREAAFFRGYDAGTLEACLSVGETASEKALARPSTGPAARIDAAKFDGLLAR